jgi:hypothetical protein
MFSLLSRFSERGASEVEYLFSATSDDEGNAEI